MHNMPEKKMADHPKAAKSPNRNNWKLELIALGGFCISGLIFIATGIAHGDILTVAGSVVWLLSCLLWMATYRHHWSSHGVNGCEKTGQTMTPALLADDLDQHPFSAAAVGNGHHFASLDILPCGLKCYIPRCRTEFLF